MFKRSVKVETQKMATAYDSARDYLVPAYDSAREHLAPVLGTAKESGSHALQAAVAAMIPVVAAAAPAMAAARSRGSDLLSSDAAHEARDRAALMLAAAKGESLATKRRRWPLVIAFFALGGALGAAVTSWLRGTDSSASAYPEVGQAGPKIDLSQPLTEDVPEPVKVLADEDDAEGLGDYSDPKATFQP